MPSSFFFFLGGGVKKHFFLNDGSGLLEKKEEKNGPQNTFLHITVQVFCGVQLLIMYIHDTHIVFVKSLTRSDVTIITTPLV